MPLSMHLASDVLLQGVVCCRAVLLLCPASCAAVCPADVAAGGAVLLLPCAVLLPCAEGTWMRASSSSIARLRRSC